MLPGKILLSQLPKGASEFQNSPPEAPCDPIVKRNRTLKTQERIRNVFEPVANLSFIPFGMITFG